MRVFPSAEGSRAVARARWLADLAEALEDAGCLLARLDLDRDRSAFDIYLRIEAARQEVQSLRLARDVHPVATDPMGGANGPWWSEGRGRGRPAREEG